MKRVTEMYSTTLIAICEEYETGGIDGNKFVESLTTLVNDRLMIQQAIEDLKSQHSLTWHVWEEGKC
jgi:hypothetical protein